MTAQKKALIRILSLAMLIACSAATAKAQETPEKIVEVESSREIVEAYGLLFFPSNDSSTAITSTQAVKREAQVEKTNDKQWKIIVKLKPEDWKPATQLTVITIDNAGNTVPTDVVELQPVQVENKSAACAEEAVLQNVPQLLGLDQKTLGELLKIRIKEVSVLEKQLVGLLTPAVLESLNTNEKRYGLSYSAPLSPETPLNELLDRLASIRAIHYARQELH